MTIARISATAVLLSISLPACTPKPPVIPYLTVGENGEGCGYDWNGAAVNLEMVPRLAKKWSGPRDVLMVFRFDPVSEDCLSIARKTYQSLGFRRIYVVSMPKPKSGDPALIP